MRSSKQERDCICLILILPVMLLFVLFVCLGVLANAKVDPVLNLEFTEPKLILT